MPRLRDTLLFDLDGTLTDTDVDNAANTFQAVSTASASAGGYGSFTMTAGGTWTYTLNNANGAVQALNAGQTLTDSFTVRTIGTRGEASSWRTHLEEAFNT